MVTSFKFLSSSPVQYLLDGFHDGLDYLNPQSMQNISPKPIRTAIKAIILHTFGIQVVRVEDFIALRFRAQACRPLK